MGQDRKFDVEQMTELLEEHNFKQLKEELESMHPVDIVDALDELDKKQRTLIFRLLAKEEAAEVFTDMESDMREDLINALTDSELEEVMEEMYVDDTVDVLEEMPANVVDRLLMATDEDTRKKINALLQYPEDSAGSIMNVEYISLRREMTVADAILKIRQVGINKETIYTCYVTEQRKLIGTVSAKELMTGEDGMRIEELMETELIFVRTHTDQEEVARLFTKYDLIALPVLDEEDYMVGIVTFDDAMDVMVDEATEDITKMAAINPSEKTYFDTSVFAHAKNRIPLLLILMFTSIITGTIISSYENAFAAIPLLVSFIPMLMDTGGNCGSQSSVTVIRGLSLGEIRYSDWLKVAWKEIQVGALCGLTLAGVNLVRLTMLNHLDVTVAMVVSLTLVVTVIISKLLGCFLPIIASRVHLDPAVMASPLITTIADAISLVAYFRIATMLLGI